MPTKSLLTSERGREAGWAEDWGELDVWGWDWVEGGCDWVEGGCDWVEGGFWLFWGVVDGLLFWFDVWVAVEVEVGWLFWTFCWLFWFWAGWVLVDGVFWVVELVVWGLKKAIFPFSPGAYFLEIAKVFCLLAS